MLFGLSPAYFGDSALHLIPFFLGGSDTQPDAAANLEPTPREALHTNACSHAAICSHTNACSPTSSGHRTVDPSYASAREAIVGLYE